MYRDFDELIVSYMDWLDKQPNPLVGDEPALLEYRRLFQVYYNSLNNPPEGVIGVGAITYAQQKLVEAQQ